MKILLSLLAVVFVLGCVSSTPAGVVVENGDHVSAEYTGRLENGTIFDTSVGGQPLEFDVGSGQLIPGFDAAVLGMKEGEEKTVTLRPADAYGMPSQDNIVEIPVANVPNGTKVGDTLASGAVTVRVIEVRDDVVVIDANHPLAGQTLVFDIKVVKITKKVQ